MAEALRRLLRALGRYPSLYNFKRRLSRVGLMVPREVLRALASSDSRFGAPKGTFSALEMLDHGKVEGRVLYREQSTPSADENSMLVRCGFNQHRRQPWPAFWARLGKTRLVRRSRVPVNAQKEACIEAIYGWFREDPDCNYLVIPRVTYLEGPWIALASPHFYHWFHEELPRLWALRDLPAATRILIPDRSPSYVWDTLRWLGLEGRARPTPEQHLTVEDFYFLSPTVVQGSLNPWGLQFLRDRFLSHADKSVPMPRRIYLNRIDRARGVLNEDAVAAYFRSRGWAIVAPETLSIAQQIALFAGAEAVCGPHGAAFANLAWCSPGCRVLELFPEGYLNGCYEGIALCLDLSYRWLIYPADGALRMNVNIPQLDARLREMGV